MKVFDGALAVEGWARTDRERDFRGIMDCRATIASPESCAAGYPGPFTFRSLRSFDTPVARKIPARAAAQNLCCTATDRPPLGRERKTVGRQKTALGCHGDSRCAAPDSPDTSPKMITVCGATLEFGARRTQQRRGEKNELRGAQACC